MYRFRTIEHLLYKHHELQKQEIYFAPSDELNDPMEGFRDVFWDGDQIVWKNFLRHYLTCMEKVFATVLVSKKDDVINHQHIPVTAFHGPKDTSIYSIIWCEVESLFFSFRFVSEMPALLEARKNPLRRNELLSYLRMVHIYGLHAITHVYRKNMLLNPIFNRGAIRYFESFVQKNEELKSLLKSAEFENANIENFEEILFRVTNKLSSELDLMSAFYNESKDFPQKYRFLLYDYSQAYLDKIETITHPSWYTACLMSSCTNPSVWSHYGDKHKGICLKFKVKEKKGELFLDIKRIYGSNGAGDVIDFIPHTLYKVNYESKPVAIDFFRSMGKLSVIQLQYQWYTGDDGQLSKCAESITRDTQQQKVWHKKYWNNFRQGATTKLADWSYENEYRLMVDNMLNDYSTVESRRLNYNFNDLDGIIFGIKTSLADKVEIIRIIKEKCKVHNRPTFNFFQAYYSQDTGVIEYYPLQFADNSLQDEQ